MVSPRVEKKLVNTGMEKMLVYVGMHTLDSGQPLKNTGKYGYEMEFLEASKTELVASFLHPLVHDFLVQNLRKPP